MAANESPTEVLPSQSVPGQKRKRPTFLSMGNETVAVIVGEDEETFTMHKELLCCYSRYFRAAFEGHFRERDEKTIRLQHVDARVFRIFCHWLYSQPSRSKVSDRAIKTEKPDGPTKPAKTARATNDPRYRAPNERRPHSAGCDCGAVHHVTDFPLRRCVIDGRSVIQMLGFSGQWETCKFVANKATHLEADLESSDARRIFSHLPRYPSAIDAFIQIFAFADEFDIPHLRDDIITLVIGIDHGRLTSEANINAMHELLPPHTSLYRFLIHAIILQCDPKAYAHNLPHEVLVNLVACAFPMQTVDAVTSKRMLQDSCKFHEHVDGRSSAVCQACQGKDESFYSSFLDACQELVNESDGEVAESMA